MTATPFLRPFLTGLGARGPWLSCSFLAILLSACSSSPPQRATVPPPALPTVSEADRWQARHNLLVSQHTWEVRGKVAYRLPDDAGSANLNWRQRDQQSRLRLAGPLGVGSTEIANEGALLRVQRDGIERLYPADAAPWLPGEALLPIPVNAIQYWLRGIPAPSAPVDALVLEDALARSFSQNGWLIKVDEYDTKQGLKLPSRLSLKAPTAELSLRVILRAWDLGEPKESPSPAPQ